MDKPQRPLFKLTRTGHLWKNRIAVVASLEFIKHDQLNTTLENSWVLLKHPRALIHKAEGWMLREVGKRDSVPLLNFLEEYGPQMPQTMSRYVI